MGARSVAAVEEAFRTGQLTGKEEGAPTAAELQNLMLSSDPAEIARRDAENSSFLKASGLDFDPQGSRGPIIRSESDRDRNAQVMDMWATLLEIGWETVTVVNCLSWPLDINLGFLGNFHCDAAKGILPSRTRIDQPRMDQRNITDGYASVPCVPAQIAKQFVIAYAEQGGVFYFISGKALVEDGKFVHHPGPDPEDLDERIEAAKDKMKAWMRRKYLEGVDNHAKYPGQPYRIDQRMRDAAKFMFEAGEIDKMPEWTTVTRDASVMTECGACGESVKKTANRCKCGFILNEAWAASLGPMQRRALGIVDAPAPYVSAADAEKIADEELDRLTRP
jgi:hypothetical protein